MRTEREIGAFITIRAKTNREREWQRERNTKNERVQSMEKRRERETDSSDRQIERRERK